MNKQQMIHKLERAWDAFNDTYAGLSEEQMIQPGVTENWSIKDILAHVNWWEEEALKHLPDILLGRQPPRYSTVYGGIDAFNAQMTGLNRGLSLVEVQRHLEETHRRLIEFLQSVPDEQFAAETRFRRRLRLDTYGHYPLHGQAIRAWRKNAIEDPQDTDKKTIDISTQRSNINI
jgi:hypothetical protein